VDNLIDAVFLAMEKDAGEGEAFIVVDDDRLTWRQVYEAYADKIGNHPPIRYMSEKRLKLREEAIIRMISKLGGKSFSSLS
jgi:nucleoside-diphosphate-sugar epimerase